MKINFVKFYQAVSFEKAVVSYISTPREKDSIFNTNKSAKISIENGIGVRISSDKDHILVPFNNVAYIALEQDEVVSEVSDKKSKLK